LRARATQDTALSDDGPRENLGPSQLVNRWACQVAAEKAGVPEHGAIYVNRILRDPSVSHHHPKVSM
jgi:hypothetical protein